MFSMANNDINLTKYLFTNYWRSEFLYAVDFRGRTMFHHAAMRGASGSLTFLLRNLDVKKCQNILHARDELGNTAFHYAAEHSEIVLAELLFNWMLLWVPGFRDFGKLRVSKYSKIFTINTCKTAL